LIFFEDNDVNELRKIDLQEKHVCTLCPTIQDIVLPIQRRVTSHDGPESCISYPQPNGDPETNENENEENHESENEDPKIMTLLLHHHHLP
jgi:hypothetical protein